MAAEEDMVAEVVEATAAEAGDVAMEEEEVEAVADTETKGLL